MLRETTNLVGVQRAGPLHKVSLYADDLILFLSDPCTTTPIALELITKFGQISGYKLSLTKSVLFPINDKACQMLFQDFPFSVCKDSFTYLGVCVTNKYKDLFNRNFKTVFNKAKQEMERWSTLPLSLARWMNSVKMTIIDFCFCSKQYLSLFLNPV